MNRCHFAVVKNVFSSSVDLYFFAIPQATDVREGKG